jgi:hypothetical protein
MAKADLTAQRVRDLLHYDPETGVFKWREGSNRGRGTGNRRPGELAGHVDAAEGYLRIRVERLLIRAHRLAWFYVYGEWPQGQIDHINGIRSDNRIANLRDVPHHINTQNQRAPNARNTTGFLGVTFVKNRKEHYRAQIKVAGKILCLGHFSTPEEANEIYVQTKRRLHQGCTI